VVAFGGPEEEAPHRAWEEQTFATTGVVLVELVPAIAGEAQSAGERVCGPAIGDVLAVARAVDVDADSRAWASRGRVSRQ